MLPDLTILVAIVLGLSTLQPGRYDPVLAIGGTLASLAVGIALTWMAGERGERAVKERNVRSAIMAVQQVGLWPLLAWLGMVGIFDWGSLVGDQVPRSLWLARYVVLFAPAGALFAFSWVQRGRIEEAMAATRGAFLPGSGARYHLRQGLKRNGIALLPMAILIGLLEAIWWLGWVGVPGVGRFSRWLDAMPLLSLGVMLVVLALLTLFLPVLLRRIFPSEPLPRGRVRDLLEHQAAQLGIRYKDILLWKTSSRVLNAMVVGVTPRTRLIFLTDALLRHLPIEEVMAVFCHEAGHAKKQHLPLFLVIFMATAVLFHVGGDLLVGWGISQYVVIGIHLAFLWFVLLGTVSRLFEREADIYGAQHAADLFPDADAVMPPLSRPLPPGTAYMIRALERIRQISGKGSSHRHGTIESRVGFLASYATEPPVRDRFRGAKKRLLTIVLGTVLLAVAVGVVSVPRDLALARSVLALEDGGKAYDRALKEREAGREDAARPHWEEARSLFDRSLESLGDHDGVRPALIRLQAKFNAADTVFHGLADETDGRTRFLALLEEAEKGGLPPESTQELRFQAHIDLGRMAAHLGDLEAFAHWREAGRNLPDPPGTDGAYFRARLHLLRGVLLGRRAKVIITDREDPWVLRIQELKDELLPSDDPDQAKRILTNLTQREEKGVGWDELRRDARLELERLE